MSATHAANDVTWVQQADDWWIALRHEKAVSAFWFESQAVNQRRSYDDSLKHPIGKWCAWVPSENGSRLITWPPGTSVEQMKDDLIAADCRLNVIKQAKEPT